MSEDKIKSSKRCSIISLVLLVVNIIGMGVISSIRNSSGLSESANGFIGLLWFGLFIAGLVYMIIAMVYNPRNPIAIVALVLYSLIVLLFVIGILYAIYIMNMMASTLNQCASAGVMQLFFI